MTEVTEQYSAINQCIQASWSDILRAIDLRTSKSASGSEVISEIDVQLEDVVEYKNEIDADVKVFVSSTTIILKTAGCGVTIT